MGLMYVGDSFIRFSIHVTTTSVACLLMNSCIYLEQVFMTKPHASIVTLPYLSVRKSIFPHHVMEMLSLTILVRDLSVSPTSVQCSHLST
jgi:hypothetical protein